MLQAGVERPKVLEQNDIAMNVAGAVWPRGHSRNMR